MVFHYTSAAIQLDPTMEAHVHHTRGRRPNPQPVGIHPAYQHDGTNLAALWRLRCRGTQRAQSRRVMVCQVPDVVACTGHQLDPGIEFHFLLRCRLRGNTPLPFSAA